ncbi:MAG: septum site-determining protein MinC [Tissierellia bacterium]|nr:septum site-determining protein MinC [Tissierellia bacterium]
MKKDLITFKGVKEGIFINVDTDDFSLVKEELDKKMKSAANFFKGTKILGVKSRELSPKDVFELTCILKYKYDLIVLEEVIPDDIFDFGEEYKGVDNRPVKVNSEATEDVESGMTKFINGTLRSGQIVEYDGNIVIIGDVNPGALIKAKGNIIVLGSLRGVAHAGMEGNLRAFVASYNLQPTQLRIGDKIARPPDDDIESWKLPEVAKIKDGEVIIEPYLPNK